MLARACCSGVDARSVDSVGRSTGATGTSDATDATSTLSLAEEAIV